MCYECGSHSRRSFTRFLAAGAGLTVLSACAPEAPKAASSSSAAPSPSPSPAAATASAGPTADAATVGQPPEAPSPTPSPSAALARQFSLDDPASPWVIVNKHRPLKPADYVPADLVRPTVAISAAGEAALLNSTTAAAAEAMFAAAAQDGVAMVLASGYRSYSTQLTTYNGYVASRGQADADTASARPGHSEHQTGWAFDTGDGGGACSFQPCFAEQPAATWAKANGHRFGFVVRYPWMLHPITGYYYEPWHLRYVGVEAATDMLNRGIGTLEEYFGLEAAPGYS
ncbi:D-alanyl-D-alanine carboxypeptidase family protein [Pseudarthrobacter sp. NIBRBAC000502771]|uniref:M15 family metallopeptidase n=1 Tax=Pseudarthrobacter sp. NIBRBAC000502771 TaxID=2590774 RepID=UPI001130A889|nr:M15 family metallopeptidase [Pseudarthrobacter sp. NIBRBAC000502771]QDG62823.1 M15 family metallopeptidase [Pseudarthrobacter sp. NIBRBAC000502771]